MTISLKLEVSQLRNKIAFKKKKKSTEISNKDPFYITSVDFLYCTGTVVCAHKHALNLSVLIIII